MVRIHSPRPNFSKTYRHSHLKPGSKQGPKPKLLPKGSARGLCSRCMDRTPTCCLSKIFCSDRFAESLYRRSFGTWLQGRRPSRSGRARCAPAWLLDVWCQPAPPSHETAPLVHLQPSVSLASSMGASSTSGSDGLSAAPAVGLYFPGVRSPSTRTMVRISTASPSGAQSGWKKWGASKLRVEAANSNTPQFPATVLCAVQ